MDVLIVTLHCSDPACDAIIEMQVAELGEVDAWPCDCGHGLLVAGVAELAEL